MSLEHYPRQTTIISSHFEFIKSKIRKTARNRSGRNLSAGAKRAGHHGRSAGKIEDQLDKGLRGKSHFGPNISPKPVIGTPDAAS